MAKFLDGPAAGTDLLLRSCPTLLRVVLSEEGLPGIGEVKVDALDQPDDKPEPGERIEVYRVVPGTHTVAFVDSRSRRGPQGRYEFADYRHVLLPPDRRAEFADRDEWRRWAERYLVCTCGHSLAKHPSKDRTGGICVERVAECADAGTGEGYCQCRKFDLAPVG